MEDEEEDEEDEHHVDVEGELQLDYVAEKDDVDGLDLEAVRDFLIQGTLTTTSPSFASPKNTVTQAW